MEPFPPSADRPLRVVAMATTGGSRLAHLLEADPNRGDRYEVVGGFVNREGEAVTDLLASHDVPVTVGDVHAFYDERDADLPDMDVRREFDALVADAVAEYDPDLVVCSGYLHVLTEPFVDRFRAVNVHHGDLTLRDEDGEPLYPGLSAVETALRAGEPATRETVHVLTRGVDRGPPLVRSRAFPVHRELVEGALRRGDEDVFESYLQAHRGWMTTTAGGPTLAKALELIADGRVELADEGTIEDSEVLVDGQRGVYEMGEGVVTDPGRADPATWG